MIEEIIQVIRNFPHNMEFHIGEYVFSGVKYRHGDHFPWHNRKSRNAFLEDLGLLETLENDRAFKRWMTEWMLEQIHIRFSFALVLRVMAYVLLLPLIILAGMGALLPAATMAVISLLSYVLHLFLRMRVARLHTSLKFTMMLIDAVIEQEYGPAA